MKRMRLLIILLLVSIACSLTSFSNDAESADANPSAVQSEYRCGDDVCDGPENKSNCPEDCADFDIQADVSAPESLCDLPNPQRAIVSQDLLEFKNYYADGSFEEGTAQVDILAHPNTDLQIAHVERSQEAAHSGSWGYAVKSGANQGAILGAGEFVEKGEEIRFSAWVRSPKGQVPITPSVFWVERENDLGVPTRGDTVIVGQEWTYIQLNLTTTKAAKYALLAFEVVPDTSLYIDDVAISLPIWRMAEYVDQDKIVGGVRVPQRPATATHFNIVIHIEDPNLLHSSRAYFEEQTAIFTELARIIHRHGGFLTIQPEQDWPQAAEEGFHPGLLAELSEKFNVVYSNHTHGPNCTDPDGIPRSANDCNSNMDWGKDISNDDIITYAQNMRLLFDDASDLSVTDHNGNFDFTQTSRLIDAGIKTLSVFKNKNTQSSYDYLYNNPWRPGQVNALHDINGFLTHDPATQIVYIPGWGQAITRHPERVSERIRPMLSQFIQFADPQRVNSFYVITHVGHFYSRTGDPNYLHFNEASGDVEFSQEFLDHLNAWDQMLIEVIDPLVSEGYLQWSSFSEIGELYEKWELNCDG